MVAGRRLPQPDAAPAQPHRVRRLLRHRRQQLRGDPALRLPRRRPPAPSTPGSTSWPTRAIAGRRGDSAFLNSTRLATSPSPGTNFFNGTNDLDGTSVTTRTPADDNMLGFDITRTGVPGRHPQQRDAARRSPSARRASATTSAGSPRRSTSSPRTSPRARSRRPTWPDAIPPCRATSDRVHAHVRQHGPGRLPEHRGHRPHPGRHDLRPRVAADRRRPERRRQDRRRPVTTRRRSTANTVRVRLGTGANATNGGTIAAQRDDDGEVPRRRHRRRRRHHGHQPGGPRLHTPDDRRAARRTSATRRRTR